MSLQIDRVTRSPCERFEATCHERAHERLRAVFVWTGPFRFGHHGRLHAVKARNESGATVYEICDDRLTPLYTPATSLGELQRRFAP